MTLSRFLRDYLYIPLGGSRSGLGVQIWALFATMALGGLWHGAGLNFIAWGILHGVGLGVGVLWRRAGLSLPAAFSLPLTFLFVMLCWVLFRSASFEMAAGIYRSLAGYSDLGNQWTDPNVLLLITAASIAIMAPSAWDAANALKPRPQAALAFGLLLAICLLVLNTGENFEFIYFRF